MRFCYWVPMLAFLAKHCPVVMSFSGRIMNGRAVQIKDFPYIVSLQKRVSPVATDYVHFCGGSIISKDAVLTAAHCLYQDMEYSQWMWLVRAGSTYQNQHVDSHEIKKTILHPKYEPENFHYDFALMFVKGQFKLKNTVQKICLPTPDFTLNDRDMVVVSGWGATETSPSGTNNLLSANVKIISQKECQKNYRFVNEVTSAMICAGFVGPDGKVQDGCYGDSGGPLVHNGVLVGVVSWGYKCGLPEYPGVYSRVSVAYKWIAENVKTLK